jgi:hypothetical protein
MSAWTEEQNRMLRNDGLEIAERYERVHTPHSERWVSVGFVGSHDPMSIHEWRDLWVMFVPHPTWDEGRVRRSLAASTNPHFRFETSMPLIKIAAMVDSVVARRVVAQKPEPYIADEHILARLAALEARMMDVEARLGELETPS